MQEKKTHLLEVHDLRQRLKELEKENDEFRLKIKDFKKLSTNQIDQSHLIKDQEGPENAL
jgi:hypothetical protein